MCVCVFRLNPVNHSVSSALDVNRYGCQLILSAHFQIDAHPIFRRTKFHFFFLCEMFLGFFIAYEFFQVCTAICEAKINGDL